MSRTRIAELAQFAAVARHRSFRGAAAALGMSASALSDTVRRLEERVGLRLLNRTTRAVTVTEAGARLLDRLEPALAEVDAALDVLNEFRGTPKGALRINVPVIVAEVVLPPIAHDFLSRHPDVILEVVADNRFVDIVAEGFDAGVRYDERLDQDMVAIPIGPRIQRYAVAATPGYWARYGKPRHPGDLLAHACIRHRFVDRPPMAWEFERAGETLWIEPTGPLIVSTLGFLREAALAGLGVIMGFEDHLSPDFTSGRLEPALVDWWPSFSGPFLYYSGRRQMPSPLRAFVDHLRRRPHDRPAGAQLP